MAYALTAVAVIVLTEFLPLKFTCDLQSFLLYKMEEFKQKFPRRENLNDYLRYVLNADI